MPRLPAFRRRAVALPARALFAVLLVASAFVAATVHAPAALAATPCWKTLLNDWYDGRIDQSYSVHCYHDALKHLPSDVQTYSSAHDDILRALQTAIAKQKKGHKTVGNNTLVPPQSGGGSSSGGSSGGGGLAGGGGTATTTTGTGTGSPGNKGNGGLAGQLNPSSPSSVPVPLLVLGGLALLLVAAGAAGLIAKRVQARRPRG